jgi:hypothetical protein
MNCVEDDHSGIPYDPVPSPRENNGRMYPPFDDHVSFGPDGTLTAATRGHSINLGADGGITITTAPGGTVVFTKEGGG